MDELHLLCGHTAGNQLVPNILVYIKGSGLWGRQVAKKQLGSALFFGIFPNVKHTLHTGIGFAVWVIRQ